MTPGRPPGGRFPSTKTRLPEPDAAAGGDFVWPPPADDPAACSIVPLGTEAGRGPRPRTTVVAGEPGEAFPDMDLEAALDQFADSPVAPRVPSTARPVLPRPPGAQPPASRWRAAALRSVVGLCIGASLALMPPPGLTRVLDARPLAGPANTEPARVAAPRRIGTPTRVRVAASPATVPRPGQVVLRDEDHIRTTLAELRAAYSHLDAGAAREVWPSVDVDALARAFGGLLSQELRFDRCDVTVDGSRARAACTGEAVYVPRVGNRGTSSAARAWTFELTRLGERWMIASARASL